MTNHRHDETARAGGRVPRTQPSGEDLGAFTRRVFVVAAVASLFFLVWHLRQTAMYAFAAVMVAAVLLAANGVTRRVLPLGHRPALVVTGLAIVAIVGLVVLFAWPDIRSQSAELFTKLPEAANSAEERFGIDLPDSPDQISDSLDGAFERLWGELASILQFAASGVAAVILVVIAGVFLAIRPGLYLDGLLLLFPPDQHGRIAAALERTGRALKRWLIGQFI